MNIKIIGSNCSNGIKLKKNIFKVINDISIDAEVTFCDNQESQKKYNIKNIPGLVINGKKFSEGNVPGTREIEKYIKSYTLG